MTVTRPHLHHPARPPLAPARDRIFRAAKRLLAAQGYENTSTAAIARLAGTSESQLMKHFGSKEGILAAIFEQSWREINDVLRQTLQDHVSPAAKLEAVVSLTIRALERDPDFQQLVLLDGRRIRKQDSMVLLTPAFREFVRVLDAVLGEMRTARQLRADLPLDGIRSALVGTLEGLLRDLLLAKRAGFPARYRSEDILEIFRTTLASFAPPPGPARR